MKIIIDSKKKVLSTAEEIIRKLPKQVPDEKQQEIFVELLTNLLISKLPYMPRKEIEKMIEPMFSDIRKSRFYREVAEETTQKNTRTIARRLLKKGMTLKFISEATGLPVKEIRLLVKNGVGQKS